MFHSASLVSTVLNLPFTSFSTSAAGTPGGTVGLGAEVAVGATVGGTAVGGTAVGAGGCVGAEVGGAGVGLGAHADSSITITVPIHRVRKVLRFMFARSPFVVRILAWLRRLRLAR